MYTVTRHEATVAVEEYLDRFVDIETFLAACQSCGNYGRLWSCPPYSFDVEAYWRRYSSLYLLASKIVFEREYVERIYRPEELKALTAPVLRKEKELLADALFQKEAQNPGSISLSAGSCERCGGCTRAENRPCRFPETMRYSLEALGGNVGMTIEKLMGIRLEWMRANRLPRHFVLVSGLLLP